MSVNRTVDTIASELAKAQEALEAAEADYGQRARAATDRGADLDAAKESRDALRLELREAVRAAGDHWPDPGRDVAP